MNSILYVMLSLTLSGSVLSLVLLAIKPLIKNKLTQTWQYYIWLLVVVRFLLPLTLQINIVGDITRRIQEAVHVSMANEVSQGYDADEYNTLPDVSYDYFLPDTSKADSIKEPSQNEMASTSPVKSSGLLDNIWLLWAGVALVLFVHKLTGYRSFLRFVNAGNSKITDKQILAVYSDELTSARVKRPLPLYRNKQMASPMLVGIIRPALVLPVLAISDGELRQIIRHELIHYKRWDSLYKWIVQIMLCLHWFNPLVYFINKQINKSCELSCDESVIKHLDAHSRIVYGDALMASLAAQGGYSHFVVSITMSENVSIVKERLDRIMGYKKKSRLAFCLAAVLTGFMLCGFTFTGAYAFGVNSPPDSATTQSSQTDAKSANTKAVTYDMEQIIKRADSLAKDYKLCQVTKAYTLAELKSLNVSGVIIEAYAENVIVERGGDKLILTYSQLSDGEYVIDTQPDMGGSVNELSLRRVTPVTANEPVRSILVVIPEKSDFIVTAVSTDSGIIRMNGCVSGIMNCETNSGEITIINGSVANLLLAKTETGHVNISGLATGENFRAFLESDSGEVLFQPQDKTENYQFIIDTKPRSRITINGKDYTGGDFKLNGNAVKQVYFDSGQDTSVFIIQEAPEDDN